MADTKDYTNYSFKKLLEQKKAFDFLSGASAIVGNRLDLNLKVLADTEHVEYQAETFAREFSLVGEINHSKALKVYQNQVYDELFKMFVYDYVKTLHNALFYSDFPVSSDFGVSFTGNHLFRQLLINQTSTKGENDFFVSYYIKSNTKEQNIAIITRFIIAFPFLKEYFKESNNTPLGVQPFRIIKYEQYLEIYYSDYYVREQVLVGEDKNDITNAREKYKLDYSRGRITLTRANTSSYIAITDAKNTPIPNGFLSSNGSKFLFTPVGNGFSMEFNSSFVFSRAYQIALVNSSDEKNLIDEWYRVVDNTNLVKQVCVGSEVYAITGIKCKGYPKSNTYNRGYKLPSLERVEKYLFDLKALNKDVIAEFLKLFDKVQDGVDFFDSLLSSIEDPKS